MPTNQMGQVVHHYSSAKAERVSAGIKSLRQRRRDRFVFNFKERILAKALDKNFKYIQNATDRVHLVEECLDSLNGLSNDLNPVVGRFLLFEASVKSPAAIQAIESSSFQSRLNFFCHQQGVNIHTAMKYLEDKYLNKSGYVNGLTDTSGGAAVFTGTMVVGTVATLGVAAPITVPLGLLGLGVCASTGMMAAPFVPNKNRYKRRVEKVLRKYGGNDRVSQAPWNVSEGGDGAGAAAGGAAEVIGMGLALM